MDGYSEDLRVEHRHGGISVYDKLGKGGHITLSEAEGEYVKDRLEEILND